MVSGCPFLLQVTLVAGEPVEIQVTLGDMDPLTDVMLGGAGEEHNTIIAKRCYPFYRVLWKCMGMWWFRYELK